LNVGSLLTFDFELHRYLKLVEALSDHSLFDVQTFLSTGGAIEVDAEAAQDKSEAALGVRSWIRAPTLFDRSHSA
jgi:hypothetical protein